MNAPIDAVTDRRTIFRYAAGALVAVGAGSLLSACDTDTGPSEAGSKPVRGGTLRAGLSGGSPTDTLDGTRAINNVDFARISALYDPLVGPDADARTKLFLAESITPNDDATSWTIKVRAGVTFHDGTPLTADDVLFTLRRQVSMQAPSMIALGLVDLDKARVVDELTLELPCTRPYAILDQALASNSLYMGIVPRSFDPAAPVGTGPFEYQSFTPGQQSVFTANADYWAGAPYADTLEITNYADETAQLNALQSGQVDLINQLSASSVTVAQGFAQVLIASTAAMLPVVMRCDQAPFDDVRVRQAMRLVVDRPKLNDVVFGGHADLGNDIFSPADPAFDTSIPQREQDIDQAKELLAEAGQSDLTVDLVVADISYGAVQSAQVFAEQAKEAGVTVNIKKVTVAEFFGEKFLTWNFSIDTWYYVDYLSMVATATGPNAVVVETHFSDPTYNDLFNQAIGEPDESKRTDLIHQMQRIDHEQGGYLIPLYPPSIDAYSNNVHGVHGSKTGVSLGNYDFASMWVG